jgi:hypothetical protein
MLQSVHARLLECACFTVPIKIFHLLAHVYTAPHQSLSWRAASHGSCQLGPSAGTGTDSNRDPVLPGGQPGQMLRGSAAVSAGTAGCAGPTPAHGTCKDRVEFRRLALYGRDELRSASP